MKNIMGMMKQAQDLQKRFAEVQAELEEMTVEGEAGAGMVTVTLTCSGEMKGIKIDPSLINPDEIEILEDLVQAAHKNAKIKAEAESQKKKSELTAGLPIPPGMNLF